MMNRDIGDGDRKRHPRLVVRQPGTRLAQRVTLGFLFGNVVGGAAPGALAFAFEEALDGPIHCIAPLQHDHVTRRPDIRILRPGDGLRHLGEQRLLKDCIAVAADDECRHFETLEPLPARPFGHGPGIDLLQDRRWSGQPAAGERTDGAQKPVWQAQRKAEERPQFELARRGNEDQSFHTIRMFD